MKNKFKVIILIIMLSICKLTICFAMTNDEKIFLKDCCKEYGIDVNIAYAIIYTENNDLENDRINVNPNGSYDFGFFQINSCHKENLCKKLKIDNIIEPKNNIKAGTYLIKMCCDKLINMGLPLDIKYIAAMYHKPKDLEAIINGDSNNETYKYCIKIENSYIKMTLNDINRRWVK